MPELPEVETIVRGLNDFLPGKTVRRILVRHEKPVRFHGARTFRRLIEEKTFRSVERNGKFIHFHFSSGEQLIAHLRMTGKFIACAGPPVPDDPHVRLVFSLSGGSSLLFKDVRLFGTLRVYRKGEAIREYRDLGQDFVKQKIDPEWFLAQCRKRSIAVKPFLLDQRVLAGLGNIYSAEALFRSGISPFLKVKDLTLAQARLLLRNIRSLLLLAIKHNGTSVRDFRNVDEQTGNFQRLLKVYGRAGEPCPRCKKAAIRRVVQAQRSTFYCPDCQPLS